MKKMKKVSNNNGKSLNESKKSSISQRTKSGYRPSENRTSEFSNPPSGSSSIQNNKNK